MINKVGFSCPISSSIKHPSNGSSSTPAPVEGFARSSSTPVSAGDTFQGGATKKRYGNKRPPFSAEALAQSSGILPSELRDLKSGLCRLVFRRRAHSDAQVSLDLIDFKEQLTTPVALKNPSLDSSGHVDAGCDHPGQGHQPIMWVGNTSHHHSCEHQCLWVGIRYPYVKRQFPRGSYHSSCHFPVLRRRFSLSSSRRRQDRDSFCLSVTPGACPC